MSDLEKKEIKGITVKLLVGIIFSTVTIVAAVLGVYYNLKHQIQNVSRLEPIVEKIEKDLSETKKSQNSINFEVEKRLTSLESAR